MSSNSDIEDYVFGVVYGRDLPQIARFRSRNFTYRDTRYAETRLKLVGEGSSG